METSELARKWIKGNVDLSSLKKKISERKANGDTGFNAEKTEIGMFLQSVIADANGSWLNADLAKMYGLIPAEERAKLSNEDAFALGEALQDRFRAFEEAVCRELNQSARLPGAFYFAWSEPLSERTDNYFGICYKEAV